MSTSPISPDTDALAEQLEAALVVLWADLLAHTAGDLSRTGASVLNTLRDGPRRITELAAIQNVAQPTMTVAVQRLETRGLVSRERAADDRRATNVVLTDAGRAKLAGRHAARAAALQARLAALSDDERAALHAALPALSTLASSQDAA
ncbi:MAG TPA: MarR family transcriptional regulator [Baekduia sp.]|uniref:MarR family winged helix-turn-helix transcriptional regulator n=1 Tax=Baekduia sp. TaxID=2600305 RepID=UPI002D767444|nr:MarR family transcriptional regulator [Baekduia sp.]HET6505451.1 MarR family transcriptional regulator [Baekduia sp.]